MTNVIVSNNLTIVTPTDTMWEYVRKNLVLDNPDYQNRMRLNKWVGGTPQYIYLYQKIGDKLVIPFGCLQAFHKLFGSQVEYDVRFAEKSSETYVSNIKLYDYQERAAQSALRMKNGVLVMPCGSGKTQTALEIIARIGGKALWLTHTEDLLNQSRRRAVDTLSEVGFGSITAGKVDIGTHITFATVQTMSKLDLSADRDLWNSIIVDECQHCCGRPTRVTQF